ncbi:MAG TPA: Asp-tRNA(Asn)/Glu-tRNA(Gln) amidotransferase subunit GatB [Chloroflexia bacterium]|nr:Asp-tRNA(Asn)/Glu-tRNA(Gln) amidotransferase subunit GatB [Chloroflexia bacterium]
MAEYLTTIGLEVHAQLLTASKMFCGCPAETHGAAAAPPNTATCPICLGMPGTLPAVNARAIELGMRTALALHGTISPFSKFDRKNYHYPDLMKGYQISQYDLPLGTGGWLEIDTPQGPKRIGITRVHLEEDTARLLHRADAGGAYSLIDVNRAGVPLMEIVGEPDIATPEEASLYLVKLRQILQYIEASTGNMEEGSFRCDANVSVRPVGQAAYGTKVEVKNMNSFKAVRRALEYEVQRQTAILEAGGTVAQETRGWSDARGVTLGQRSKEFAHDYRYFPEPDLPPLTFTEEQVAAVAAALPELPTARRDRLMADYGLPRDDADLLTETRPVGDYFERALAAAQAGGTAAPAKALANLVIHDVLKQVPDSVALATLPLTPERLVALQALVDAGTITITQARALVPEIVRTGQAPDQLVAERGLAQIRGGPELDRIVAEVIAANPKMVGDYLGGKAAALQGLIGPLMRATRNKANAPEAQDVLRRQLDALARERAGRTAPDG